MLLYSCYGIADVSMVLLYHCYSVFNSFQGVAYQSLWCCWWLLYSCYGVPGGCQGVPIQVLLVFARVLLYSCYGVTDVSMVLLFNFYAAIKVLLVFARCRSTVSIWCSCYGVSRVLVYHVMVFLVVSRALRYAHVQNLANFNIMSSTVH